jgi:predicted nucleic acid-binding protein
VDSSVAVKWFVDESESNVTDALELLADHRDGEILLAAPSHLLLEVLNALRYRGADERTLADAAAHLLDLSLEIHELADLAAAAAIVAARHDLTLYDAAFAALADALDAELIASDARIVESGACDAHFLGESRTALD